MIRRNLSILLLAVLAGCAGAPAARTDGDPLLAKPLSPASLGHRLLLSQLVTGQYDNEERSMRVELDVTPERLVVVALSPLGLPLFTLEQVGDKIETTRLGEEDLSIDPRHVLSDIQLTYWPEEAVRQALSAGGYRLEVDATREVRQIFALEGRLLAEITYPRDTTSDDEILIRHFDPDYSLRITTIGSDQ